MKKQFSFTFNNYLINLIDTPEKNMKIETSPVLEGRSNKFHGYFNKTVKDTIRFT